MASNKLAWRLLVALLVAVFTFVVVRSAWMCDDAYITLRRRGRHGDRWKRDADPVRRVRAPLGGGGLFALGHAALRE